MTYEIETIDPSVQTLLETLANLNLIKFRRKSKTVADSRRAEALEGWEENVRLVRAHARGEIQLPSAWALVAELEKEAA